MDKKHAVNTNMFRDISKYANVAETFTAPEPPKYEDIGDKRGWLQACQCSMGYY